MKMNLKARDWHNWVSVILLLPMLLVGLTAVFLAHKKELGLNELDVTAYVSWLPGYGDGALARGAPEVRAFLLAPDGRTYVGTQGGLFVTTDGVAAAVAEFQGDHVRAIVAAPWGVVAVTRRGVWNRAAEDGSWLRVVKGDAWSASLSADGVLAVATKDRGVLSSANGQDWTADAAVRAATAALPSEELAGERVSLGKLMVDLHTGRAFLGKQGEWIWIDLLGAVWVFLGFTGLWLWWRSQTKRRDAAAKRVASGGRGA